MWLKKLNGRLAEQLFRCAQKRHPGCTVICASRKYAVSMSQIADCVAEHLPHLSMVVRDDLRHEGLRESVAWVSLESYLYVHTDGDAVNISYGEAARFPDQQKPTLSQRWRDFERAVESIEADRKKAQPDVIQLLEIGEKYFRMNLQVPPLLRDNYQEETLRSHDEVTRALAAGDTRRGRLFLYRGAPGTGKTHLLYDLLRTPNCFFVRVDSHQLVSLDRSHLRAIREDAGERLIVFILDEADGSLLAKRTESNASALASLLNMADGFSGKIYNLAVVMSTNLSGSQLEIDPAIRTQRLNVEVHVPQLPLQHATQVWLREMLRRGVEDIPAPWGDKQARATTVSLATIYSQVLEIERARNLPPIEEPKIGFSVPKGTSYLGAAYNKVVRGLR